MIISFSSKSLLSVLFPFSKATNKSSKWKIFSEIFWIVIFIRKMLVVLTKQISNEFLIFLFLCNLSQVLGCNICVYLTMSAIDIRFTYWYKKVPRYIQSVSRIWITEVRWLFSGRFWPFLNRPLFLEAARAVV